ncbi:MAG: hypothetical protein JW880_00870 [Candidatus Thermoplasmatota archaeon]|nr:hypothetical protein [Candidatus Thermoplasmatota archaeon]
MLTKQVTAQRGDTDLISIKMFALPFVVLTAVAIAAAPAPIALDDAPEMPEDDDDDSCDKLVNVSGEVTELIYKDCEMQDEDGSKLVTAFVIDDEVMVEFGPWWYWAYLGVNMTDFLEVGDEVNVTGEWEEPEDDMKLLCAWHIDNLTTDEQLTIKEEGRPPWAGGPKALGIDPWPSSKKDG